LESRITMAELQKLNSKQVEGRLASITEQIKREENQVSNYRDLLVNNISDSPEVRRTLNSILSEQVLSLPSDQVTKKIKKIAEKLNLFDGEIDISKNIQLKNFRNVEEIKEELDSLKLEKANLESLLGILKDVEKAQAELNEINAQIETIKFKLQRIKTKPSLSKSIEKLTQEVNAMKLERDQYEVEQKKLEKKLAQSSNDMQELVEDKKKREDRIRQIAEYYRELVEMGLAGEEFETSESLDQLYNKIKLNQSDRIQLKINKDKLFDKLRERLQSTFANEEEFIKYVEEEVALIEDKENSISALLESISTQFANPAYTILKRYEEFREFVVNKFNTKLSQARISDIENLRIELIDNKRLVDEVRKISQIQQIKGQLMFEFDHSENLKILNAYLDSGKKIDFDDLFDIQLSLSKKGQNKTVDLGEQIESDGTDKMIRLVIVMSIINRLAINDNENRIALFIDEVATIDKQNRPELVRFCQEHHFIPIFAAPDAVPGFGKYYFIFPSPGKINISEKANAAYGEVVENAKA
jgi:hypothetical protein